MRNRQPATPTRALTPARRKRPTASAAALASTKKRRRGDGPKVKTLRILFTCVGRRVQLLNAFRKAAENLGVRLIAHGADAGLLAPALHLVDKRHLVPPIAADGYIHALLEITARHRIDLLIPLLDFELPRIAEAAPRFQELQCRAVVSSPRVVGICRDKLETFRTLTAAGIDTPRTATWREALDAPHPAFPLYMKPRFGSAGVGNFLIHNVEELAAFGRRVQDPIVQEFVDGVEHTLDVYCGPDGAPRCVVPRRRIEIRTGEVSKAVTVKDRPIMDVGRLVAKALADCQGVVTVQCIVTRDGRIRVIEINPRFGGGAPLAIHAGADFPRWLLMERLGKKPRIRFDGFRSGVVMLRYDEAVYVSNLPIG